MCPQPDKIRTLAAYIGLSVLVHLLVLFSLGRFGSYHFAMPVNPLQDLAVNLVKVHDDTVTAVESNDQNISPSNKVSENMTANGSNDQLQRDEIRKSPTLQDKSQVEPEPVEPSATGREMPDDFNMNNELAKNPPPVALRFVGRPATVLIPPLRTAKEFLAPKAEKLTYLISLLGVPVGSAELEARNKNGEIWITLRTRSYTALSNIYAVDDTIETRHISGNFIITNVMQQEGTFRSNIGFTIFLRDKKVFWIDRIRNRYSNETLPNCEVLDTLSSFYYLRNRPLQTGKTETLHIYDGDSYAPVQIEVLRQEELRLRSFRQVDTLLLRHVQQKVGIFRRTGDMLIWLTNDENKVPVKVETTFPLGKVTADLVSAETQKQ